MGRPRGFDEEAVTRAAVALFASRAYDGLSVDDLVTGLGVHRNSLYKTFGSKRGLYLTALRWYLRNELAPLLDTAPDTAALLRAGARLDQHQRPPGRGSAVRQPARGVRAVRRDVC